MRLDIDLQPLADAMRDSAYAIAYAIGGWCVAWLAVQLWNRSGRNAGG